MVSPDSAQNYEAYAQSFLDVRDNSTIGSRVVERWAKSLPADADVLEVACGGGVPITQTLVEAGLNLWAIDASPTLLSVFRSRYPQIPVECARVQDSEYFARRFDAVLAIGLMFLLAENEQVAFVRRMSGVLEPGGRLLFSAPVETGTWNDVMTGQESLSLGRATYQSILREARFEDVSCIADSGGNNYYNARLGCGAA